MNQKRYMPCDEKRPSLGADPLGSIKGGKTLNEEINKIRELLDKIEKKNDVSEDSLHGTFDYFELPQIIASVIDFLQPLLSPYESVIYWFLFRHSIIETADRYIRVSNSQIAQGIGSKFKSGDKVKVASDKAISDNLRCLMEKKVIVIVGDTNRDGTLYKINLPEEIELCIERMKKSRVENTCHVEQKKDLDYYNIAENRLLIFERDGYVCYKCRKQLTRFSATLDHIQPVSQGGDNSYSNLITCCLHCNSSRGAKPIMEQFTSDSKVF